MDYTNNDKEIVFLNDKNIVHELSGENSPAYNAIPSQKLVESCYNDLCTHSEKLCADAVAAANTYTDKKLTSTSDENDKKYVHLTGDVITGSLSISTGLAVGENAVASEKNSIAFGRDAQANQHDSFVWNGNDRDDSSENSYLANGAHTFNINPAKGLSGIYVGKDTLNKLIDDKVLASKNEITSAANATYAKSDETYTISQVNEISSDLSTAVKNRSYVTSSDIDFEYKDSQLILSVRNSNDATDIREIKVSTAEFEKGRFLESVSIGIRDTDNKQCLILTFKLEDNTNKTLYIPLDELIEVYKEGNGIKIDTTTYQISIDDSVVANKTDVKEINDYLLTLKGTNEDHTNGIIGTLSSDVDILKIQNTRELKFDNIIHIHTDQLSSQLTSDLTALIRDSLGDGDTTLRNGSIFLVQYENSADTSKYCHTQDDVKLGNNDYVIVRTLKKEQSIVELSDIVVNGDNQNVYITNAVHRYEYENLSSDLSNAIVSANTKIDNKICIDGVSAETLCAQHIDADAFHKLVVNGELLSNVVYVVSSDYLNAYDQRVQNVATPSVDTDAANKKYVDTVSARLSDIAHNEMSAVSSMLSNALINEITVREKTDTALSLEISSKVYIGDYIVSSDNYSMSSTSLSIVKIHADDYHKKVANHTVNDDIVYIVSSDYLNAYDQRVQNVATPSVDTDAANKKYVDEHGLMSLKSAILNDPVLSAYKTSELNINTTVLSTMLCAAVLVFNTAIKS